MSKTTVGGCQDFGGTPAIFQALGKVYTHTVTVILPVCLWLETTLCLKKTINDNYINVRSKADK